MAGQAMDLSFDNHYVVGVVIFMITLLFFKHVLECAQTFLQCWQTSCLVCLEACSCSCVHYGNKELLHASCMALLLTLSVAQPIVMLCVRWLSSTAGQSGQSPAWTVNFVDIQLNMSAFSHQTRGNGSSEAQITSMKDSASTGSKLRIETVHVTEVDMLLILMPFAMSSAVTTWIWLSLKNVGVFNSDPIWDIELFVDARMQVYELMYSMEIFVLFMVLSILVADPVDLLYAATFSSTCCLLTLFLCACSRTGKHTEGINMPMLAFALLCTLLSVFASRHWRACLYQQFCCLLLVLYGLSVGCIHLSTNDDTSAGTMILARTCVACSFSLCFMVLLAVGANELCAH